MFCWCCLDVCVCICVCVSGAPAKLAVVQTSRCYVCILFSRYERAASSNPPGPDAEGNAVFLPATLTLLDVALSSRWEAAQSQQPPPRSVVDSGPFPHTLAVRDSSGEEKCFGKQEFSHL